MPAATLRAARALASSLGIVHLGEFEQDVGLIRREIRAWLHSARGAAFALTRMK